MVTGPAPNHESVYGTLHVPFVVVHVVGPNYCHYDTEYNLEDSDLDDDE